MAVVIDLLEKEKTTLEEYIDYLESNINFNCKESIIESSLEMKKLLNNKQWFIDRLCKSLKTFGGNSHKLSDFYTSQTDVLYHSDKFFLRTNAWIPTGDNYRLKAEKRIFGEELPHDHSFNILTGGLLGSGYTTKLHKYSRKNVVGYVNERVDIEYNGHCRLEEGRILFMEKNVDIHSQIAPEELSISFNLMVPSQEQSTQYLFEIENSRRARISNIISDTDIGKVKIVDMIGEIGDENSLDLILEKLKLQIDENKPNNESLTLSYIRAADNLGASMEQLKFIEKTKSEAVRKNYEYILGH
jgi:hypothetical protein